MRTLLVALCAAAVLASCRKEEKGATGRSPEGTQQITGTVRRADEARLVIHAQDRPDVTLRLTDRTSVTVDGQPAAPQRLLEGTEVRASFSTENGGTPTAVAVEAKSPIERNGSTGGATEKTRSGAHGGTGSSPGGEGPGVPSPDTRHEPAAGRAR
jgi:hypothetical protein